MATLEITDEERFKLRELIRGVLEDTVPSKLLLDDLIELSEPVVVLARELEAAPYDAEIRHHWEGSGWRSFDVLLAMSNLVEDLLLSEDELDEDRVDEVDALLNERARHYGDSANPQSRVQEDTPPIAIFELVSVYETLSQRIEGLDPVDVNRELVELLDGQPIPDFFIDGRENGWDDPAVVEAATNFYLSSISDDRLRELIGEEPETVELTSDGSNTIGNSAWDLLPPDLKALPDFLAEKLGGLSSEAIYIGTPAGNFDPVFWDPAAENSEDSLEAVLSVEDEPVDTSDDGEWGVAEIDGDGQSDDDGDFSLDSTDGFLDEDDHGHHAHGHSHGAEGHVHQLLEDELRGLDDYDGEPADEREVATLALISEGLLYAELSEIFLQDLLAEADPLVRRARAKGSDWWMTADATMAVAELLSQILLGKSWPADGSSLDIFTDHRAELQKRAAVYPLDPEPDGPTRAEVLEGSTLSERLDFLRSERGERAVEGLTERELADLKNSVKGHLGSNPTDFLVADLAELLSDEEIERGRMYGVNRALWKEIWARGVELLLGIEAESENLRPRLDGSQKAELSAAVQSYRTAEYTEEEFLKHYDSSRWPSFGVTVDLSIFTIRDGRLQVLLIERGNHPEKGKWALPGGFVNPDESLDRAARRELQEETGVDLEATGYLEQVKSYGYPGRDPRGSVVSTLYAALIPEIYLPEPEAADDAAKARFVPVEEAQGAGFVLAFDHDQLLKDALLRVRSKIEYSPMVFDFLKDEPFTIEELREVYEIVWGMRILPSDFRRRISQAQGALRPATNARGEEPHWIRGTATRFFPPLDILEVEFLRD